MGQQLRIRIKQQRRKCWIERKKKAAHLAAKAKPKTAPSPAPAGATATPTTADMPSKAGVSAKA